MGKWSFYLVKTASINHKKEASNLFAYLFSTGKLDFRPFNYSESRTRNRPCVLFNCSTISMLMPFAFLLHTQRSSNVQTSQTVKEVDREDGWQSSFWKICTGWGLWERFAWDSPELTPLLIGLPPPGSYSHDSCNMSPHFKDANQLEEISLRSPNRFTNTANCDCG